MQYQEFDFTSKSEVENLLKSPRRDDKISALVGMVNVDDWVWIQNKLLEYIHDSDFWIAKNAITGLGDVARVHGKLDVEKVKAALEEVKNKDLSSVIKDAFSDFSIYLKK